MSATFWIDKQVVFIIRLFYTSDSYICRLDNIILSGKKLQKLRIIFCACLTALTVRAYFSLTKITLFMVNNKPNLTMIAFNEFPEWRNLLAPVPNSKISTAIKRKNGYTRPDL